MMMNNYLAFAWHTLTATLYRFPVAVIASLLFTLLALNESFTIAHQETYLYTLCCVVFIAVAGDLDQRPKKYTWLNNVLALAAAPFIFWQYKDVDLFSWPAISFLLGLFLTLTVIPYIFSSKEDVYVWEYNKKLWQRIGLTILASAILMFGSKLIILTLQTLFGIRFEYRIFLDSIIVTCGAFATIFAMAGIPSSFDEPPADFPKGIRTVINGIAVPLLLIYAVILYGYILKIIIAASLPRGSVAYLVSIFGSASTLVYLAAFPVWQQSSGLSGWFGRHFFKFMFLPLLLLALSLKTRIQDYGITESRYMLGIVFIWVTITTFAIVLKARHRVQIILTTLPILLLAAAIGPLSMSKVSEHSQVQRLQILLEKNDALEGGVIKIAREPIDSNELFNICSIVDYLIKTKKTRSLQHWYGDETPVDTGKFLAKMGLKYVPQYMRKKDIARKELREYAFNIKSEVKGDEPIEVSGYDFLLGIGGGFMNDQQRFKEIVLNHNGQKLTLQLNFNKTSTLLTIVNASTHKVLEFDLSKVVQKSMLPDQFSENELSKDIILTQANEELEVTLKFDRIDGYFVGDDLNIGNFWATLLFKIF